MIPQFQSLHQEIPQLLKEWEPLLSSLSEAVITERKNAQNRSIKQILGHLIDSASNNTHRIVHLQYRPSPVEFPNYATEGNNDRWIAIQNYQQENWKNLIQHWKYANQHFLHVVSHIQPGKLNQEWIAAPGKTISLEKMVVDYLPHFKLHLGEIHELIHRS